MTTRLLVNTDFEYSFTDVFRERDELVGVRLVNAGSNYRHNIARPAQTVSDPYKSVIQVRIVIQFEQVFMDGNVRYIQFYRFNYYKC